MVDIPTPHFFPIMKIQNTFIEGLQILTLNKFNDPRGSFIKMFNVEDFLKISNNIIFEEIYYSHSVKNVIRGFHFQIPPYELDKLVCVIEGTILDVVIDLRKHSETYGRCFSIELSDENNKSLYIPKGIGHAFLTLTDKCTMLYATTKKHSAMHDTGIKWNSVEFDWQIKDPIISEKDNNLSEFVNFKSPF